tara:strand:- start:272 stop:769 length:498 start_codon:yes stop_codon:yes gene_type:complete
MTQEEQQVIIIKALSEKLKELTLEVLSLKEKRSYNIKGKTVFQRTKLVLPDFTPALIPISHEKLLIGLGAKSQEARNLWIKKVGEELKSVMSWRTMKAQTGSTRQCWVNYMKGERDAPSTFINRTVTNLHNNRIDVDTDKFVNAFHFGKGMEEEIVIYNLLRTMP